MAERYHVNPATGNPGVCHAKIKCRFGDLTTEHYATRDEARAAYEASRQPFAKLKKTFSSNLPTVSNVNSIAIHATKGEKDAILSLKKAGKQIVELQLKDWSSANAVKTACEEKGFMAEYGPAAEGQWLRVQAKPKESEITPSSSCDWDMESRSFLLKNVNPEEALKFFKSSRTGEVAELTPPVKVGDEWEMAPYNPMRTWKVRIIS